MCSQRLSHMRTHSGTKFSEKISILRDWGEEKGCKKKQKKVMKTELWLKYLASKILTEVKNMLHSNQFFVYRMLRSHFGFVWLILEKHLKNYQQALRKTKVGIAQKAQDTSRWRAFSVDVYGGYCDFFRK